MSLPEAKKASISVDPSVLQHLLDQIDSLKTQVMSLPQQAPAPAPAPAPRRNYAYSLVEFGEALAEDPPSWKRALAVLPQIEWVALEPWLVTIFCRDVMLHKDIDADRRALWQAILWTGHVSSIHLSKICHKSTSSRTALLNLVLYDVEDGEMSVWVTSNTPASVLHASFMEYRLNNRDLVAVSAYHARIRPLYNLFRLKASDGQLVFPRDATSSWTWSKFWPEIKTEASAKPDSDFMQCLRFWFAIVDKEIQA